MQVAAPRVVDTAPRANAPLFQLSMSATKIAFSAVKVDAHISVQVQQGDTVSVEALKAMKYIAGSTRLSPSEKRTLIRLVAVVDQFAGGDPKLMKAVIGIAKVMEMDTPEGTYRRHSLREALEYYWQERRKLGADPAVRVDARTEIRVVQAQYEAWDVHIEVVGSDSAIQEDISSQHTPHADETLLGKAI